jgi:molecular chaperone DnaJ
MAEREWFDTDYYKVLGVAATASDDEITKAYRKLAKQHHPDASKGSEDRFKEISAAYDVVGDPVKRKEYDEVRRLGPAAAGVGASGARFTGDFSDLGDLFGGLFGQRRTRSQRGADLETALHLSFRDSVKGVTTSVQLPGSQTCHLCQGRGAASGGYVTCETCHGKGVTQDNQGPFAMSSVCSACQGRGISITTPCPVCHGSGREPSSRTVNVRIPAGVVDGQRIRLKGKGQPGQHGGAAGDLYVDVHVSADSRFARKGRHVMTTATISMTDAILGTTVQVETLDDVVTLRIPEGTQPGTTLRVRSYGVPAVGQHPAGDLLVTVAVTLPTTLTRQQRQLVEKLAASMKDETS